jgi:hypothetical protein
MRRRRREHSLLLKASKILVSPGTSVNLTLSHRRRALRSFPLARGGGIRPPPRETLMLRAPREIGVGISPQVEPGVSADENSKLGDGALHAESTLTLRLFRLAAHCNWHQGSGYRQRFGASRTLISAQVPPCLWRGRYQFI